MKVDLLHIVENIVANEELFIMCNFPHLPHCFLKSSVVEASKSVGMEQGKAIFRKSNKVQEQI